MEIKRINENQIRCFITEQEIEEMGFLIDDIIGNAEESQKFMHRILEKVEEQEQINMELTSPVVRAELMPDHSMAITFGSITEEEKKTLFDKMMQMLDQMKQKPVDTKEEEYFSEATPFAIKFIRLEDAIHLSKILGGVATLPENALYKFEDFYYMVMDLKHFSKKSLRPFAFLALEYDDRHYAEASVVAYIKEHGKCLIKKDAVAALMQL